MPSYRAGEEFGFLEEFLYVVLAKMGLLGIGWLVERENVICGFEFRDCYESDLCWVSMSMTIVRICATDSFVILVGSLDASGYACQVLGKLFCALGIYLHVVGHYCCTCIKVSWGNEVQNVRPEILIINSDSPTAFTM